MVSLSYRPLANYISEENLVGLRNFLDNRKPQVDDRDEVRWTHDSVIFVFCLLLYSTFLVAESKHCFNICGDQR